MSKAVAADPTADNPRKWEQARQRDVDWEKKDLLEVIYWLRQWFGLICGIVWGILPITGLPGHMLFVALNAALLFIYYTKYLQVDDEDAKYGRWELIAEGMWPSYTLFLITWICVYSLWF